MIRVQIQMPPFLNEDVFSVTIFCWLYWRLTEALCLQYDYHIKNGKNMKIIPLHDNNAIESVTCGVEWQEALPPNVMASLETVYEAILKDKLPSKKPLQQYAFKIDLAGSTELQPPAACGWLFERFEPDGRISHRMQLSPKSLVLTSFIYDRWNTVFKKTLDYMRSFLPLISVSTGGVTAFVLEYVDLFNISLNQGETISPEFFLRRESKILPASIFEQKSLWHAHHGYFTDIEGEPKRRRLTIANVDLIEENRSLKLRILTAHRTIYSVPISDPNLLEGDPALMNTEIDLMHIENKTVISDLLNDEVLKKIGIRSSES